MSAIASTSSEGDRRDRRSADAPQPASRRGSSRASGGVRGWIGGVSHATHRGDIVLAPRRAYLVRTLTVPAAPPRDTLAMVRLTLEAALPASFGAFCVSILETRALDGGLQQVTCALMREDDTGGAAACAVAQARLLPSQAVWAALLEHVPGVDAWLLHADGEREVAVRLASGEVVVRAVASSGDGLPAELLDVLHEHHAPALPLRVCAVGTWSLGTLPADVVLVRPQELGDAWPDAHALATHAVRRWLDVALLDRAELLSSHARQRRDVSRGVRSLAIACGLLALSGACIATSFTLETRRLERRIAALHASIKDVEKEGDAAGVRVSQARAVRDAAKSRQAFFQGLAALHGVTGTGITYTSIASRDGKVLEAAGRAPSVGVPFLLPQQLEQTSVLRGVQLLDASQTQRGDASVVEFRLQCTIVPGGAP